MIVALRARLKDKSCRPFGDNAGVATVGDSVRYPDASVTCSAWAGPSRLVPDPVVVFEVVSPTSGHTDRIAKLGEYAVVDSMRRYFIAESASVGLTVHERQAGGQKWTVAPAAAGDTLFLPEIGIEIPVAEIYDGGDLPQT